MVLQQHIKHGLTINLLKSKFYVYKTMFLEHVINSHEIQKDLSKLEIISKWPIHIKKKEVQAHLVSTNYVYWFIANYSAKTCTFIDLIKGIPFT